MQRIFRKHRLARPLLAAAAGTLIWGAPVHADSDTPQPASANGRMPHPAERPQPQCSADGTACAEQGRDGLVRDTGRTSIRVVAAPRKPRGSGVWLAGPAIPPPDENRAEPAVRAQP